MAVQIATEKNRSSDDKTPKTIFSRIGLAEAAMTEIRSMMEGMSEGTGLLTASIHSYNTDSYQYSKLAICHRGWRLFSDYVAFEQISRAGNLRALIFVQSAVFGIYQFGVKCIKIDVWI